MEAVEKSECRRKIMEENYDLFEPTHSGKLMSAGKVFRPSGELFQRFYNFPISFTTKGKLLPFDVK